MIYIKLFLSFLKIGAVSFGGGYGMISLIRETVLVNDWLSESEFMSFVAVSESTPGPLAVNMATFIGSSQGGVPGAFLATLGVVLPSFIIVFIIASVLNNLLKYPPVEAFLIGVRPCIIALISATAVTMGLSAFLGITDLSSSITVDWSVVLIFILLLATNYASQKTHSKSPSPILMILISAVLGICFNA
ncbi:MAG: chromate transporter [Lachnospiraceae bacterium]|nr:chromate transporter [Lachnospiraceae bacterium]